MRKPISEQRTKFAHFEWSTFHPRAFFAHAHFTITHNQSLSSATNFTFVIVSTFFFHIYIVYSKLSIYRRIGGANHTQILTNMLSRPPPLELERWARWLSVYRHFREIPAPRVCRTAIYREYTTVSWIFVGTTESSDGGRGSQIREAEFVELSVSRWNLRISCHVF